MIGLNLIAPVADALRQRRHLRVRERRDDVQEAFRSIACSLICFKQLPAAVA
jgi:hypothetical protein